MNTKHTYTLESGRRIMLDGKPFVTIQYCGPAGDPRVDRVEADDFARLCASAPELQDALTDLLDAPNWPEARIKAKAALALCEKEN